MTSVAQSKLVTAALFAMLIWFASSSRGVDDAFWQRDANCLTLADQTNCDDGSVSPGGMGCVGHDSNNCSSVCLHCDGGISGNQRVCVAWYTTGTAGMECHQTSTGTTCGSQWSSSCEWDDEMQQCNCAQNTEDGAYSGDCNLKNCDDSKEYDKTYV